MSRQMYKQITCASLLAVMLALSACDTSTPGQINVNKIRLTEEMRAETMDARQVDVARVERIANHFTRTGIGEMTLNVSYDANNPDARATAEKRAADYKKAFTAEGAKNVATVVVPISNKKYADQLVATYNAAVALPPKDCKEFPGKLGTVQDEVVAEYQFGCENQTTLSRMIVDPNDLMGTAKTQDGETTRYAPLIDNYKTGKPNQRLEGYTASGIGG